MNQLTRTIGGALLLEDDAYITMRDAENGFTRGLTMIVTISLIVGLVISLVNFINAMQTTPAQEVEEARKGMEQALEAMRAFGPLGVDQFSREFMRNFEAGLAMADRIAQVVAETTPAPQPIADFFEALGQWVSYPFGWISTWMLYGVLTLIFAKLLGGAATIQEMLATTSLIAIPHLLDAFNFIPYVGPLVGVIAFLWGLAVYVKGIAVANRFDVGKALLAFIAPLVVLFGLIVLVTLLALVLIAIA